jgi:hypothetical protein
MSDVASTPGSIDAWRLRSAVDYIARVQRPEGLIPWYEGGPADPWDHVESAMGLTVGGRYDAAADAYRWLAESQLEDGSWWAVYSPGGGGDGTHRETHRSAYVATGVWHHYLVTGDHDFLETLWPTVEAALEFALDQQRSTGEVAWAVDPAGQPDDEALITGSSSVAFSLACGRRIAAALGHERPGWVRARAELCDAIRSPSGALETAWMPKDEFAMYWFYPVLAGVLRGEAARERLDARLLEFVEPGLGCRCDATEPWVTVAESAELVMAMLAAGRHRCAEGLFDWLFRWRDTEGVFWTGYQFEDDDIWPEERPTWTSGAVLLAADALGGLTPAADLFTDHDRQR